MRPSAPRFDFTATRVHTGIYVGAGLPTVLIDELERTLGVARECFDIREISVETNPNHLTPHNVDILKESG